MRVIGQFNKISDALQKSIKPLRRDEIAHYRLLTGEWDAVSGETRYGSHTTIPGRDNIYDEAAGRMVEIGVPKKIVDGEVSRAEKFIIAPVGENLLNNGVFSLNGANGKHQEFFEYFEISNYNKSNGNRDTTVTPLFERIDEVAEAEADDATIDTLTKALVIAQSMSTEKIKSFAAGKNWNLKLHPAILRKNVKKYAQEFPEDFVAGQDDPAEQEKVTIKRALDAGIIVYQPLDHKITWADGKTLANLDKPENGESEVELFYAWKEASKNGDNILKSIANKVKNTKAQ